MDIQKGHCKEHSILISKALILRPPLPCLSFHALFVVAGNQTKRKFKKQPFFLFGRGNPHQRENKKVPKI